MESNKFACEWCQKKFSRRDTLLTHQKTAKYCIKIQEESKNERQLECFTNQLSDMRNQIEKLTNEKVELQRKFDDEKHILITEKLELQDKFNEEKLILQTEKECLQSKLISKKKIFEEKKSKYKKKISDLEGAKNISGNGNTTIYGNVYCNQKVKNIIVTNIEPFTVELIKKNIDKFDYFEYSKGPVGLANFLLSLMKIQTGDQIERNYACTDAQR